MGIKLLPHARSSAFAVALGLAALLSTPTFAATCGTILSPVEVSATPVNFGTYDPTSSATTANGTVTIRCELNVDVVPPFTVSLSSGTSGNYNPRTMTLDGSPLSYNLYTTASHVTVWGDGTNGTVTQASNGLLVLDAVNFTVYGRLPGSQFVKAGAYTDTIIVSVEY